MENIIKIILKIVIGFLLLLVILLILSAGTFFILNKNGKINGIAQYFMNQHLVGEMRFDSLHFDFAEFPVITVSASNGVLLSDTTVYPTDTLAAFQTLKAQMNPFKIFTDNLIDIPYVYLQKPQAIVLLSKEGRPGWAIWRFKKPTPPGQPHKRRPIKLNIAHVEIYGYPKFYYHNFHTGMKIEANAKDLFLIGRIAIDYKVIDADYFHLRELNYKMNIPKASTLISTQSDSIYIRKHLQQKMSNYQFHMVTDNDTIFVKGKPVMLDNNFEIHGKVGIGYNYQVLLLHDLRIQFDTTTLWLRGDFRKVPHEKAMFTNLQVKLSSPSLNQSIRDIYPIRSRFPKDLVLSLPLLIQADMKGIFSPSKRIYPDLFTHLQLGPGKMRYANYPEFRHVETAFDLFYLPATHKSDLTIRSLKMDALGSTFTFNGEITDLFQSPAANIAVTTHLELNPISRLNAAWPQMQGNLVGSLWFQSPIAPLFHKDVSQLQLHAQMAVDSLGLHLPDSKLYGRVASGLLRLDIPKKTNSSRADSLFAALTLDSLFFKTEGYPNGRLHKLNLNIQMPWQLKLSTVTGRLEAAGVEAVVTPSDSIRVGLFATGITGSFRPKELLPDSLQLKMALQQIYGQVDSSRFQSHQLGIYFEGNKQYGDTLHSGSKQTWTDRYDLYDFSGGMMMKKATIQTPVLPLRNEIDSLEIVFTKNVFRLLSLICKSGESALSLQATVNKWSEYLLKDSSMVGEVFLLADSLNLTQLIPALAKGTFYLNKRKGTGVDSLVSRLAPPKLIPPSRPEERTKEPMITIPPQLNIRLHVDARNVSYEDVRFDESHGKVLITDRSLMVHNVFVDSNLGDVEVGASYQPADTAFAHTSLSVQLKRLDVNELLGIIPDLNKVVPMLNTLEGFVGCSLSASADLDSTLYILMPSLNGSAQIHGRGLSVDKDKILPKFAGRLLFGKNKKIRLDSVLINLTVKDDILSIYPFMIDLSRYRLLASGVQEIDDSFFYHFSLQKWFLPFKIGFNIYKEKKKLHFKLACPKLKDMNLPARILSVSPDKFYPSADVPASIRRGMKQQQSVFMNFSDYYDSFLNKESEEISRKQTDAILLQLDTLRQKTYQLKQ